MKYIKDSLEKNLKNITKGAIIILLGISISKIFTYAYRVLAARHPSVGPEGYGILSISLAVFGIISLISIMGLNQGVIRYVASYTAKNKDEMVKGTIISALKITLPFSIILSILLFILSEKISLLFFSTAELSKILKLISIAVPLDTTRNIFLSALRGFKKVKYEMYSRHMIENISKLFFAVIFIYLGWSILGLALAYIIGVAFSFILSFYLLEKKVFPILSRKFKTTDLKKKLLKYSWPLLFTAMLVFLMSWIDTFMIGYLTKDASLVGIYNAAVPTAQMLWVFPPAILTLFIPILTQQYVKKEREDFNLIYKIVTRWIFLVNIFIMLFFVTFSTQIISIIFGQQYLTGGIVLKILAIGLFLNFSTKASEQILMIIKKTKMVFINTVIGAVLNIVLNAILIPHYGLSGAAIATSLSYGVIGILVVFQAKRFIETNPFDSKYINRIIISIIPFIIGFLLIKNFTILNNLVYFFIMTIIIFILYIFLLITTKSLEKEDLMIIKVIINKAFSILKTNKLFV